MRIVYLGTVPEVPRGGHRTIVDHVRGLRSVGHEAYLLVESTTKRVPAWADLEPSWVLVGQAIVGQEDLVVVPENLDFRLGTRLPGRTVILNQLAHPTTENLDLRRRNRYLDAVVEAIVVVDARWLPGVHDTFADLIGGFFVPNRVTVRMPERPPNKERRIVFLGAKERPTMLAVVNSLIGRDRLRGWTLVEINGIESPDWFDQLARSAIVLTFSPLEAFGLVQAEALAMNCALVGFAAEPRAAFWNLPAAHAVAWRDVSSFVQRVEGLASMWVNDHDRFVDATNQSAAAVVAEYTEAAQVAALNHFVLALGARSPRPTVAGEVRHLGEIEESTLRRALRWIEPYGSRARRAAIGASREPIYETRPGDIQ